MSEVVCLDCGGGPGLDGACLNCGAPIGGASTRMPAGEPPELEPTADPHAAQRGLRELVRLMGDDPDREGLRGVAERAMQALCGVTIGYDEDVGALLVGAPRSTRGGWWSASTDGVRSLCQRCLMPWTARATVIAASEPGGPMMGELLGPLLSALASRIHSPASLAGQLAAAVVELGGAAAGGGRVEVLHGCLGRCGAGGADHGEVVRAAHGELERWPDARAELRRSGSG